MSRIALLAVALFVTTATHAAPSPDDDARPDEGTPADAGLAETMVVTASLEEEAVDEAPAAVTVLDGETLRRQGIVSIDEALRRVPGTRMVRGGSPGKVASLFVRGVNSNQVLVLYDGMEMNTPFFGGYDLAHLSIADVDRIEVVRGPFSALYGSQAMGGVVNVITRRASGDGFSGTARFEAGSDDHRLGSLDLRGAAGGLHFAATLERLETDNLEGQTVSIAGTDVEVENDRYDRTVRSFRVGSPLPGGASVELQLRETDAELGVPYSGDFATDRARQEVDETVWAVPLRVPTGGSGELTATYSRVDQDLTFRDPQASFSFQDTSARLDSLKVEQAFARWGDHRLFVGAEREEQEVDNRSTFFGFTSDNLAEVRLRTTSAWAQYLWDATERLRLTAGVRHDDFDRFGAETTPRLTARYALAGGKTVLRAAAGRAFRAPTPGELFFPFSGNPELSPEVSEGLELGVVRYLAGRRIRLEATAFRNDLEDLIVFSTTTFLNENIDRARTQGLELSASGVALDGLTLGVDYTYLDAEDRDADPDEAALLRRAEHQARVWIAWRPVGALGLYLEARWVDDRPDFDPVSFERADAEAYTVVDLSASWSVTPTLDLRARLANLLDQEYDEALGFPALGRTVRLGLATRF